MATLEQFLRTGELGLIHVGMSESEVTGALGQPDRWTDGRDPIKGYGALQLEFRHHSGATEGELKGVGLIFNPELETIIEQTPKCVLPMSDFKGLSPRTTFDDFHEFLDRVGLWQCVDRYKRDGEMQELIIPPPGARITFDGNKLWSIHFHDPTPSAPPKKQISFSVSEDTFSQLKRLARQSKKSVAALCADWVTQRANDQQPARETVGSCE